MERERDHAEYRRELLDTIVRGSLVASQGYEEKALFGEYFEDSAAGDGGDAEAEFDYSGVEFEAPDESEMEILSRLLGDDSVSVDGAPIEGPGAQQVSSPEEYDLPAPRELDLSQFEQDPEWT